MQDRVPTKPNRCAVYDDNHNFVRYEYHERADEPTQAGDALNKANLLPDNVATALGLTGNPQVRDALSKLTTLVSAAQATANGRSRIVTGSYRGTGTFGENNPTTISCTGIPDIAIIANASTLNVSFGCVILIRGPVGDTYYSPDILANYNRLNNGGEMCLMSESAAKMTPSSVSIYTTVNNSEAPNYQLNNSAYSYNYFLFYKN